MSWQSLWLLLVACGGASDDPKPTTGDSSESTETTETSVVTDADRDGHASTVDCDDDDPMVYPGAPDDDCNGVDDDCDGAVDEDATLTLYEDLDGDGFGGAAVAVGCDGDAALLEAGGDCDDADPETFPGATDEDRCDGVTRECGARREWQVPGDAATVQGAVDVALAGDTVCVGPGTWGPVAFLGLDIEVVGVEGRLATILEGSGGSVVQFEGSEGRAARLEGFTVTGGQAVVGGGISLGASSATLRSLFVSGNEAEDGGGIHSAGGSPLLEGIWLQSNLASEKGGGVFLEGGEPVLRNVMVRSNVASFGGGLRVGNAAAVVDQLWVEGNDADVGGGLFDEGATTSLTNGVFLDNQAGQGGAMNLGASSLQLAHASIVGNRALRGSAVHGFAAAGTFTNVVVAHQSGFEGSLWMDETTSIDFDHTVFFDNGALVGGAFVSPVGSSGNMEVDPGFVDWPGADLRATGLVDLGTAATDPDGTVSDIGAFSGPGAGGFDLDLDGAPAWWSPEPYGPDQAKAGWDCDDRDPATQGC